jgi:uncharacterized protein (TIGR02466 family)
LSQVRRFNAMNLIELFGVYIGSTKLESLDIVKAIKFVNSIEHESAEGGDHGQVSVSQMILHEPFFKDVKDEIEHLATTYVSMHGHAIDQVQIASSWGNILTSGEPIHAHSHANSYVSGSFYLTTGAPIHFHNPLTTEELFTLSPNVVFDEKNKLTWRTIYIEPTPGQVLFFPSKLKHHVESNNTNYRYSIAFNTLPTGAFGHTTKHINISSLR